ncbi:MAG TPA: hypothetical protein VGN70_01405 [Gammaproteobacteria bacterium]|jgi:hypothetical protein
MGVIDHGVYGARDFELGIDIRRGVGTGGEHAGFQAAGLDHLHQLLGVGIDGRDIGGHIGQGQEVRELAHDLSLMGLTPGLDLLMKRWRGRGGGGCDAIKGEREH